MQFDITNFTVYACRENAYFSFAICNLWSVCGTTLADLVANLRKYNAMLRNIFSFPK